MIKFEQTEVWGFEHAIRGMRNPLESWYKSDSGTCSNYIANKTLACHNCTENRNDCASHIKNNDYMIGENDLGLMKRLIKAGSDHSKFTRQIMVSVDITAPDYFFKEFDTYKVGTVANSTSTMHKIMSKEFTIDMFSLEDVVEDSGEYNIPLKQCVINLLNNYRNEYLKTKDKRVWRALIQLLPMSFNYTRTVTLNYAVLRNMYHNRKTHKLSEWSIGFVNWVGSLPYSELITSQGEQL